MTVANMSDDDLSKLRDHAIVVKDACTHYLDGSGRAALLIAETTPSLINEILKLRSILRGKTFSDEDPVAIEAHRDWAVGEVERLRGVVRMYECVRAESITEEDRLKADVHRTLVTLAAEVLRIRPVYEAAKAWHSGSNEVTFTLNVQRHDELERDLARAVDAALAIEKAP